LGAASNAAQSTQEREHLTDAGDGRSAREWLALGRHDRTCAVGASQDMARRLPNAYLVVFEDSAHMMSAEEQDRFLTTVRHFLDRITRRHQTLR
jgi:pimeloyl-ACP methyl ester carboxylesterase